MSLLAISSTLLEVRDPEKPEPHGGKSAVFPGIADHESQVLFHKEELICIMWSLWDCWASLLPQFAIALSRLMHLPAVLSYGMEQCKAKTEVRMGVNSIVDKLGAFSA